jgi:trigger factor
MNVVLEELPNCEVSLRVEVPAERVDVAWKTVSQEFQRHAKLPGFRPGKTPAQLIETKFAREIRGEVLDRLLKETLNEALREKKVRVLGVAQVDGPDLGADRVLRYTATIITEPDFALPEYDSIEVELAEPVVGDAQIAEAFDRLREPHADFSPVEGRGLAMGDYAVLTYASFLDGQPLAEAIPAAPPLLAGRQNFWLEIKDNAFLPGFIDQLLGLSPEAEKEFTLELPEDFPLESVRGKSLAFKVTLHEINAKSLPEWSEELAEKIYPGKSVEELREFVASNLKDSAQREFEQQKRNAAMAALRSRISCPLPARLVNQEMSSIMRDIVADNQQRGIPDEELRSHENEIMGAARQGAEERIRGRFLLLRIAEKEKLQVSEQDLTMEIMSLSQSYNIPVKKLVADIWKKNAITSLQENILINKAVAFLAGKVKVVPPKATA